MFWPLLTSLSGSCLALFLSCPLEFCSYVSCLVCVWMTIQICYLSFSSSFCPLLCCDFFCLVLSLCPRLHSFCLVFFCHFLSFSGHFVRRVTLSFYTSFCLLPQVISSVSQLRCCPILSSSVFFCLVLFHLPAYAVLISFFQHSTVLHVVWQQTGDTKAAGPFNSLHAPCLRVLNDRQPPVSAEDLLGLNTNTIVIWQPTQTHSRLAYYIKVHQAQIKTDVAAIWPHECI